MNKLNNEKYLLLILKYGAVVPIVLFSVIVTYFIIQDKNHQFEKEILYIKDKYIKENKSFVKQEVTRLATLIEYEVKKSDEHLKKALKEKVYEAHNIATNIYKHQLKNKKVSQKEFDKKVLKLIKQALGGMIYNNNRGYIFIDSIDGTKLLQPTNKSFEGKNLLEYEDAKGYNFVKKIVKTIKNKTESYDSYYWYKSKKDPVPYKKMSFYKTFKPLNIAIGTGEYLIDYEKELKNRLLQIIQNIRFKDNGYIFILNDKGDYISHIKKELIGTNAIQKKDLESRFNIKSIIDFAIKDTKGFIKYKATLKPSGDENTEKISYIYNFKDWNWIIGAGFYLDELNNQIDKKINEMHIQYKNIIKKTLASSALITAILILISFYLSKILEKRFRKYKLEISNSLNEGLKKEKLLIQQSKMALMGEMIANIAHQWKQPLGLIKASNSMVKLNKEYEGLNTEIEINEAIEKIDSSVDYLSTTIDDFRNFFDPNKHKNEFSFKESLNKALQILSSQLNNNEIIVLRDFQDFTLNTYKNELLHVLTNIIKNAKDELVKRKVKNKVIEVKAEIIENKVFIYIKDNAGGINQKILDKIFDAYFTTKKDEGTGIGLYMSKQIIENMQGQLSAKNQILEYKGEVYKGAEFIIELPAS